MGGQCVGRLSSECQRSKSYLHHTWSSQCLSTLLLGEVGEVWRTLCLYCQHRDSKEAVRAQAACPGAWRKGFSGSGEALNLFFCGLPQKWSDITSSVGFSASQC